MKKIEDGVMDIGKAIFVELDDSFVFTFPCETILISWISEDYHIRVIGGLEAKARDFAKVGGQTLPENGFALDHLVLKPYFDIEKCGRCGHRDFDRCKVQPSVLAIHQEMAKLSR